MGSFQKCVCLAWRGKREKQTQRDGGRARGQEKEEGRRRGDGGRGRANGPGLPPRRRGGRVQAAGPHSRPNTLAFRAPPAFPRNPKRPPRTLRYFLSDAPLSSTSRPRRRRAHPTQTASSPSRAHPPRLILRRRRKRAAPGQQRYERLHRNRPRCPGEPAPSPLPSPPQKKKSFALPRRVLTPCLVRPLRFLKSPLVGARLDVEGANVGETEKPKA